MKRNQIKQMCDEINDDFDEWQTSNEMHRLSAPASIDSHNVYPYRQPTFVRDAIACFRIFNRIKLRKTVRLRLPRSNRLYSAHQCDETMNSLLIN